MTFKTIHLAVLKQLLFSVCTRIIIQYYNWVLSAAFFFRLVCLPYIHQPYQPNYSNSWCKEKSVVMYIKTKWHPHVHCQGNSTWYDIDLFFAHWVTYDGMLIVSIWTFWHRLRIFSTPSKYNLQQRALFYRLLTTGLYDPPNWLCITAIQLII